MPSPGVRGGASPPGASPIWLASEVNRGLGGLLLATDARPQAHRPAKAACMHLLCVRPQLMPGAHPACREHPSDRGHQALAELLSSLLIRAMGEERSADSGCESRPERWAEREAHLTLRAIRRLPPPMIPGNDAPPRSACDAAAGSGLNSEVSGWAGGCAGCSCGCAQGPLPLCCDLESLQTSGITSKESCGGAGCQPTPARGGGT